MSNDDKPERQAEADARSGRKSCWVLQMSTVPCWLHCVWSNMCRLKSSAKEIPQQCAGLDQGQGSVGSLPAFWLPPFCRCAVP